MVLVKFQMSVGVLLCGEKECMHLCLKLQSHFEMTIYRRSAEFHESRLTFGYAHRQFFSCFV